MKFVIITHVNHIKSSNHYFGYAPYVREMNIWLKYVNEVIVVGPFLNGNPAIIDIPYSHSKIDFRKIPDFNFMSFKNNIVSFFKLPIIFWEIFWAMKEADHIHLRCPGNVGLIGCLVQMLFPRKIKTAKYAGNWDSKSNQPWTYKLQKKILNSSFLTRNMKVLAYGDWENQSNNIKSFFTATYSESEKLLPNKTDLKNLIEFVFVGTLVAGKNPMYAIRLVEQFIKENKNAILNLFGEGSERIALEEYIRKNNLENYIFLNGNQNKETIKKAYQKSHFVILPSKSEGWPKAIAEGMFWGCIPIATKISCVPFMLDYGNRGILLEMDLEKDVSQIENIISNRECFLSMSKLAASWSQQYTTEIFELEIKKLLLE
ncbi:Glycosyltransferase involved in cell wall bisynthesis [Flavobacterium aquidurense]|uniref:Glycosyl transferase n=1 Tax=Flavobacterium frigidimaris TaxID=262320 RepID=A0ABX4BUZ6_FLAFR|nr:glycosyltransferase [Flavobacterium frigidimaris]OXA81479.1 glycosyl transferase [Flavobacterium frigidimaris]SDZ05506.1 Glycosyltransferase involved in cell wall bisynthesis [Flavobacterium aquidurense]